MSPPPLPPPRPPERLETREKLAQLNEVRGRLNRLYYARVPAEKADEHARAIRKSIDRRNDLERQLADAIGWNPRPPDPDAVAAALPIDAALVDAFQYRQGESVPGRKASAGEPRYVAFVVRRDAPPRRVDLGPCSADRRSGGAVAAACRRAQRGTPIPQAASWPSWRGLRYAPHLAGVRAVLVAPDGALNRLPFGALPDAKPGAYLLERYALGTVLSGRQVVELARAERPSADGGLLAVGGVDYGHGERAASATPYRRC